MVLVAIQIAAGVTTLSLVAPFGFLTSPAKFSFGYQINFTPSCITRLPTVNCRLSKNKGEVRLE